MSSVSFPDAPMGVFRRVAGDHRAPAIYFINKNAITFGNSQSRDVFFEWVVRHNVSVLVRKDWQITPMSWKIVNENAKQIFVNEKLLKAGESRILISGQKFRFGEDKVNSLTYSFHLYTADNPAPPEETKMYDEWLFGKINEEATRLNSQCAKMTDYMKELERGDEKQSPKTDCIEKPKAALKLISSTLDTSPDFYFFDKKERKVLVFESIERCALMAVVQQGVRGWKIINESRNDRFIVGERYIWPDETFILKLSERILFGGTETFSVTYEFKLYSDGDVPSTDMKCYVEHRLEPLLEEAYAINRRLNELKAKLEKQVPKTEQLKRESEEANVGGSKKMKQEPSDESPGETANVKAEADQVQVKEEPENDSAIDSA